MPASTLGNHQNVLGATPAAAADAIMVVPANQVWRFINFHFQFASSATVATRSAAIQVLDAASNPVTEIGPGGVTQTASLTKIYNFQVGANSVGAQGLIGNSGTPDTVVGSLPSEFYLLPGYTIRTKIASLSASDQITAVSAYVEIFTI